jgi:hypothetical protein
VTVTVTGATPPVFAPVPAPVCAPVPLGPGVPNGTIDKPSTPPAAGAATAADMGELAPATGKGSTVDMLGELMVRVDWAVGDTVCILGRTSIGAEEAAEMDGEPLGEKKKRVPGLEGVGGAAARGEDIVGTGLDELPFLEAEAAADIDVAGGVWDDTNGNVSPLLPLVVAAAGIGAGVVDTDVELTIGVALLAGGGGRVVVTVTITVVYMTLTLVPLTGLGAVPFEGASVGELFGFAAGMEGNSVSGGDEPGLLPTAGTIPTMPLLATAVG